MKLNYALMLLLLGSPNYSTLAFTVGVRQKNQQLVSRKVEESSFDRLWSTTVEDTDIAIPYDAAAKLAYENQGGQGDYDEFRRKFEADAIADVISKTKTRALEEQHATASDVVSDTENEEKENDVEEESDSDDEDEDLFAESDNEIISELQEKLRHWKGEQTKKETEYNEYLRRVGLSGKIPPIYKRIGKVDRYTPRPVYDKETERIQSEISELKEHIIWTQAHINEERRIEQLQYGGIGDPSGAGGMVDTSKFEEEINRLRSQLGSMKEERIQIQQQVDEKDQKLAESERKIDEWTKTVEEANEKIIQLQDESYKKSSSLEEKEKEIESLAVSLKWAKETQERISQEADFSMRAMKTEYETQIESMKNDFEKQLSDKKLQIDNLSREIQGLVLHLQDKRNELVTKESVMSTLRRILGEKEEVLESLMEERDSLRSMGKQGWNLLKTRFKKRVLRKDIDADTYESLKAEKVDGPKHAKEEKENNGDDEDSSETNKGKSFIINN